MRWINSGGWFGYFTSGMAHFRISGRRISRNAERRLATCGSAFLSREPDFLEDFVTGEHWASKHLVASVT
jgi:hypothetical protein